MSENKKIIMQVLLIIVNRRNARAVKDRICMNGLN